MKIKRIIDGKSYEFDLTKNELLDAFYEQERNFDKEDVIQRLSEQYNNNTPNDTEIEIADKIITVGELKEIIKDNNIINNIAEISRSQMSGYDAYLDALWDCVDDAIDEYFTDINSRKNDAL